jgi:hypothetical protein
LAKQLLIYESAVPVSDARHRHVSVAAAGDHAFSAGINAVPLMAVEFLHAAAEYVIVFTDSGGEVLPAAVLGVRDQQNLYLSAERQWQARYVPAFIRRYPFVFSRSDDGQTFTLCIDESHPGVNREGRGERLFGDDGKPSAYVERVLRFLQEYQAQFERTRAFGRRVKELGLLEPMQAQLVTPQGDKLSLSGFFGVRREQLRALSDETLGSLARSDELELLYLQMHSMRNFEDVKDRLVGAQAQGAAPTTPQPTVEPVSTVQ